MFLTSINNRSLKEILVYSTATHTMIIFSQQQSNIPSYLLTNYLKTTELTLVL